MNYSKKHIKLLLSRDEKLTRNDMQWIMSLYALSVSQAKAREKKARESK